VLRLDVTQLAPIPEVGIAYDGLAGLSQRPILRDIVAELHRHGKGALEAFLKAVDHRGSGKVYVYFDDYVSYGIGGGDASSQFYFGSYLLLQVDVTRPFFGDRPESPYLLLLRPEANERLELDAILEA